MNLKRNFFLTEKEQKYIQRIKEELGSQNRLFDYIDPPKFLSLEEFIELSGEKL